MLMKSITLLLTCTLALAACDKSSEETSSSTEQASSTVTKVTIASRHFTDKRPQDVKNLLDVKNTAQKGDKVVFLARVGGKSNPFLDKKAIFLVADPSLVSCELMTKDMDCPKPQDYCCEDPGKIREGLATIQFVDGRGKPLDTTAEGAGGLESLKFVVVNGTVRERNDEGLFIVDAREIWVGGKPNQNDYMAGSLSP